MGSSTLTVQTDIRLRSAKKTPLLSRYFHFAFLFNSISPRGIVVWWTIKTTFSNIQISEIWRKVWLSLLCVIYCFWMFTLTYIQCASGLGTSILSVLGSIAQTADKEPSTVQEELWGHRLAQTSAVCHWSCSPWHRSSVTGQVSSDSLAPVAPRYRAHRAPFTSNTNTFRGRIQKMQIFNSFNLSPARCRSLTAAVMLQVVRNHRFYRYIFSSSTQACGRGV